MWEGSAHLDAVSGATVARKAVRSGYALSAPSPAVFREWLETGEDLPHFPASTLNLDMQRP